jgi:O-antigen/teichoic acid export membrane protein
LSARASALAFVASAVVSAIGFGLAVPLIPALFSKAFAPAVPLLGILLVGIVPFSIAKVWGNYLAGVGAMRLSLAAAIVTMLLTVLLDFTLIPRHGAFGAAIATAAAYLAFTLTIMTLVRRQAAVSILDLLRYATERASKSRDISST